MEEIPTGIYHHAELVSRLKPKTVRRENMYLDKDNPRLFGHEFFRKGDDKAKLERRREEGGSGGMS